MMFPYIVGIVGFAFIAGSDGAFISQHSLTTKIPSVSSPSTKRKHPTTTSRIIVTSTALSSSSGLSLFSCDFQCNRSLNRLPRQQLFAIPPPATSLTLLRHTTQSRRQYDGISGKSISYSRSSFSRSTHLFASEQFYDDFEDFGELGEASGAPAGGGSNAYKSNNNNDSSDGKENMGGDKITSSSPKSSAESSTNNDADDLGANDDAVMNELRKRMNALSKMQTGEEGDDVAVDDDEEEEEEEEEDEDEEDDEEEEEDDDEDSGSALPDLEGSTISSIDDIIGFAQAKARIRKANLSGSGESSAKSTIGGTWEAENWARPIPINVEEDEEIDFDNLLEGGIILIANPAKFCSDLATDTDDEDGDGADSSNANERKKSNSFLGGLFDDPFPSSSSNKNSNKIKKSEGISPALLAKFGITLPPSPDLGPDRRADLLPVVLLIDRDPVSGCRAVLMNRRTGNLMGDLPSTLFQSTTLQQQATGDGDADDSNSGEQGGEGGYYPPNPHPLSAFMIQPLWWAGSSPGVAIDNSNRGAGGGGGINAIRMVHACPYVNGSVPLAKSDGLYWGGNPVQAQEAMRDERLEKPLTGFDFKFFIQTTRWLPSQLEQEIKDGVWYLATVSKEVLFRSRDRLGAKRAKPLWTEIIELLGDDYMHIRDQLYGEEE